MTGIERIKQCVYGLLYACARVYIWAYDDIYVLLLCIQIAYFQRHRRRRILFIIITISHRRNPFCAIFFLYLCGLISTYNDFKCTYTHTIVTFLFWLFKQITQYSVVLLI